jgi:DNA-binding XRE family transcriptional regulator
MFKELHNTQQKRGDKMKLDINKIKNKRESLGLTKSKLADIVEVHRSTIGRIEDGTHFPSTITLQRLADVFGIQVSDLIVFESDEL